jgi:hypothetical protein
LAQISCSLSPQPMWCSVCEREMGNRTHTYTHYHTTPGTRPYTHYTTHTYFSPTALHCSSLHYTTLLYIILHYTALHYTALHYTTLHCTTLHYTTLYYTALHYTALHYTTLHCSTRTTSRPAGFELVSFILVDLGGHYPYARVAVEDQGHVVHRGIRTSVNARQCTQQQCAHQHHHTCGRGAYTTHTRHVSARVEVNLTAVVLHGLVFVDRDLRRSLKGQHASQF